ncbi:DUF3047 domain-containing protein [Tropicimonas marinistellae]|uniref:DUF3047 domain-containing protein n=1 Tax=Tropicimonas marinistellae TaxID=1739787 RepID=UPI0013735897|nr:DUF3047 domain-containing protein [Tropicimonas marinistellae]
MAQADAAEIPFDRVWREQTFPFKAPNDWFLGSKRLGLQSEGSVSLIYRQLDSSFWRARNASWQWSVQESVPPTDLTRKGGDDRNLALYFLFLPEQSAKKMEGASLSRVLRNREARALVYVHGGAHQVGLPIISPYLGPRGMTIPLQPAEPGTDQQSVNLDADFRKLFRTMPGVLFGLAISGDSDDTSSKISADLSGLELR